MKNVALRGLEAIGRFKPSKSLLDGALQTSSVELECHDVGKGFAREVWSKPVLNICDACFEPFCIRASSWALSSFVFVTK